MRFISHLRGRFTSPVALTIGLFFIVCPSDVSAHVKWFAPFNVDSEPRSLVSIFTPTFGLLFVISLVVMLSTAIAERTPVGAALLDTLDRIGGVLRPRTEALLRACAGAFLVALFVLGNVILTPELKTQSAIIPWLQVAMAIGLFWRPTMILSGLGIVALYVIGIANYGVFHLLDYPIFLGLAAFFIFSGLNLKPFNLRPFDIARWGGRHYVDVGLDREMGLFAMDLSAPRRAPEARFRLGSVFLHDGGGCD